MDGSTQTQTDLRGSHIDQLLKQKEPCLEWIRTLVRWAPILVLLILWALCPLFNSALLSSFKASNQELSKLEHDHESCAVRETKLESKVSDLQVDMDHITHGKQSCVLELGQRAAENVQMATKMRELEEADLHFLHHVLHWKWRSEQAGKERNEGTINVLKEMLSKLGELKGEGFLLKAINRKATSL